MAATGRKGTVCDRAQEVRSPIEMEVLSVDGEPLGGKLERGKGDLE